MKKLIFMLVVILLMIGCTNTYKNNESIEYTGIIDEDRKAITGKEYNDKKNNTEKKEKYDKDVIDPDHDQKGITPEDYGSNDVDTYSSDLTDDERRKKYIKTHPRLSDNEEQAIRLGIVMEGMTRNEVKAAIGQPDEINSSTYGSQWVYSSGKYVYFEHGTVDAIQNH